MNLLDVVREVRRRVEGSGRLSMSAVLGDDAARVELLREAQRGYASIGAPIKAERIAAELAS